MSASPEASNESIRQNVLGFCLLLIALLTLGALPFLPARGASGLNLPFLDAADRDVVVAFAGYPGCSTVCPTSLALMADAHRRLEVPQGRKPELLFINVQRDSRHDSTMAYARAFHQDFRGHTVTSRDADVIYRSLALASYADDDASAGAHSGFIYIFVRDTAGWRIEHVYRSLPGAARLSERLERLNAAI